jgi:hypothetical protein
MTVHCALQCRCPTLQNFALLYVMHSFTHHTTRQCSAQTPCVEGVRCTLHHTRLHHNPPHTHPEYLNPLYILPHLITARTLYTQSPSHSIAHHTHSPPGVRHTTHTPHLKSDTDHGTVQQTMQHEPLPEVRHVGQQCDRKSHFL